MSQPTGELIVIERAPKEGTAKLVEDSVQAILDDHWAIGPGFMEVYHRQQVLPYDPQKPSQHDMQRYARAEKMRQLTFGATIGLIGRVALPAMVRHVEEYGKLTISPFIPFDPHKYTEFGPQSEFTYRALRASYHLVTAGNMVFDEIEQPGHPYHGLYRRLQVATKEYYDAWVEWSGGPGLNRWPSYIDVKKDDKGQIDARSAVMAALCINVQLGVSLSAARGVHYLIHQNRHATADELDRAIARTLPRTLWIASTDRHLGWTDDWLKRLDRGEHIGNVPEDGALALLQASREMIVSPNSFAASLGGLPIMSNQNFCPHALVQNGPVAKAASCAGDPWIRYKDSTENRDTKRFFEQMGFRLPEDGSFNFAAVALAMGRRLVGEVILPHIPSQ